MTAGDFRGLRIGVPGAGVLGRYELSNMGTGSQTCVLWKNK